MNNKICIFNCNAKSSMVYAKVARRRFCLHLRDAVCGFSVFFLIPFLRASCFYSGPFLQLSTLVNQNWHSL